MKQCQAFGDVYREVPHHRCCLGTWDPSEPFEGLCGNGRFSVSGFCGHGLKVSAARGPVHMYLGVHFLWFSAFVSWVEISVCV